jgi:hypothetical protein
MPHRVLHGLPLRVISPAEYVYDHAEGPIRIKFHGRICDLAGAWKADWRIKTAKGISARGYPSLSCAAELLAASVYNARHG